MGVNDCIDCNEKKAAVECNCIPVENADGTLQTIVEGCTDPTSCNYNALANCDDGSCIEKNPGCMDPSSLNYSTCYNADCAGNCPGTTAYAELGTYGDTSCCCSTAGCMDSTADNYNASACIDDGSCQYTGCMDPAACNYDAGANVACSSCCNYPPTASVSATACDSYTWALDGQTYYTSGTYTHSDGAACPTTTTLNLTINNATSNTNTQTVCTSYTWAGPLGDGDTKVASGIYTHTSTNALGCTHTETLDLTIQPEGCTDPTSLNYDSAAICDDGSCIAPVGGCTYGGSPLPTWNSTINDGGPNSSSTWAALYNITDPGIAANNYNASANVDDGSCTFHVYGCTDPTACNYDPNATADDGSCVTPTTQDLGDSSYGQESPNCLRPEGDGAHYDTCSSTFQYPWGSYGIAAYPYETGEPAYGAHCTKNSGSGLKLNAYGTGNGSNNDDRVYSESYYFMATNLTIGSTVCITWAEIVLALRYQLQCSDCLMGGWWVKIDEGSGYPPWSEINNATSIYDPVANTVSHGTSPGGLSTANTNYHNSEGATNDPGNSNGKNTAGAPNGSYSEWNEKCITFQATATTHRIHFVAVTDFDQCTTCHSYNATNNRHGAYVGISKVQISSDGCTGNCSC